MTLTQIQETLLMWCQQRPVLIGVLFGSQATGQAQARSDIDVALWPDGAIDTPTRLRWLSELEQSLENEVSLVIVSPNLDPVLGMEIVRHGQVIFARESELWARERARLWHAYNDSLPFRRAARQRLREFAEEVRRAS